MSRTISILLNVAVLVGAACSSTTAPRPPTGLVFSTVSSGTGYSCGLTTKGTAYCWGGSGALGIGNSSANTSMPVPVAGRLSFQSISAAYVHTCALATSGAAYCWGDNDDGELGTGSTTGPAVCGEFGCSLVPVAVAGGLVFTTLNAGGGPFGQFTCGITPGGTAYCWGTNRDGELGTGTNVNSPLP